MLTTMERFSIIFFVFSGLSLPTGYILYFNVKLIAIGLLLLVITRRLLSGRLSLKLSRVFLTCLFFLFMLFYYARGYFFSPSFNEVNAELKIILSTFLYFSLLKLCITKEETVLFYKSLLFSVFIYFTLKLVIAAVGYYTGQGALYYQDLLFNVSTPTWEIMPGIERIQYVNDIICILVFYLCIYKMVPGKVISFGLAQLLFVLFFLSVLLAYSRLLFAIYFGLFIVVFNSIDRSFVLKFSVFFIFLVLGVFYLNRDFIGLVINAIEFRFDSGFNYHSDNIRNEQFLAILDQWLKHPFLGGGIGSFNDSYIRGNEEGSYFLYEMQLFSLLMKYGIFGFTLWLILILSLFLIINKNIKKTKDKFFYFSILSIYIFSSLTNPYLFSSASGVLICSLVLTENGENRVKHE